MGRVADRARILDAGDAILALIHHTGRGHASGISMDSHDGMLFRFRDGKALAAAGLSG
jgi:ketosteroid isomerase-like protein